MASKERKTRSAKAFVMVMPGGWPIISSVKHYRRDVVAWADEDTYMGGWCGLRKRGYRIEKMMLAPISSALGEQSE
ncbi:hypothetical protein LQT97_00800 [Brucella pseudogrignonensis]|uniref:hypothetical protein n=1 Tax=Brucella pseudogrignonensis TaxID=419475 RepID=UPI001E2B59E6|nr:hypothetical protein [Brucella pseudogrignonensis]MCD4509763.1 hypothetical protein [Brucella pseudogrignonensis]